MGKKAVNIAESEGLTRSVEVLQQEQHVEPANVSQDVRSRCVPEMDEEDIAEMSMIAAEIESAESFNLTFETVEKSDMEEYVEPSSGHNPVESLIPRSELEEVEEVFEQPNDSVVEKANTSLAEALLSDWGSPVVDCKHTYSERTKSAIRRQDETISTSTPKGREPFKDLKNSASSIGKRTTSNRKRISNSSNEGDAIPAQKRNSRSSHIKTTLLSNEQKTN